MTSLYWIRALIFTQIIPIITILCQILGSLNWVMVGSMSCLSPVCCWAITSTSDDLLSLEPNLHWNLNQNMENYAQGNAFENGICKMALILFQSVDKCWSHSATCCHLNSIQCIFSLILTLHVCMSLHFIIFTPLSFPGLLLLSSWTPT